jgi:hypothetical protein
VARREEGQCGAVVRGKALLLSWAIDAYPSESRRTMLTLSFVEFDHQRTVDGSRQDFPSKTRPGSESTTLPGLRRRFLMLAG